MISSTHLIDETKMKFCLDTESESFLIFAKTARTHYSHLLIYIMSNDQKIRCIELSSKKLKFDFWIELSIRLLTTEKIFITLKEEFHIMSNLSCDIVIETDTMKSFDISSIWEKNEASNRVSIQETHLVKIRVSSRKFMRARKIKNSIFITTILSIKVRQFSKRKAINVYAINVEILNAELDLNVLTRHKSIAASSYVFELIAQKDLALDLYVTTIHALVTSETSSISVANFEKISIKIRQNQLLERLRKINSIESTSNEINFDYANVFMRKYSVDDSETKKSEFSFIISVLESSVENSNINLYWEQKYVDKISNILLEHKHLFRKKLDRFNNDVEMSISFQNKKHIEELKQASYVMIVKDKKVMNEILDLLIKEEQIQKVFLSIISSASSSIFVIYKNDKSRIVVDLKRVNTRLYLDAYSLFKQDMILDSLSESTIFFFINLIKEFFQQKTRSKDWWKITFVTSHRDLKWLTVFSMSRKNALEFFQHRMKSVFANYLWKFVLVYMNDVIIFSIFITKHLTHLKKVLTLLEKSEVILFLRKCHFEYLSITILEHHVSRLELSTLEKKTKIIKRLRFSRILKDLKQELEFFDYYRKFVLWYANIEKFLIKLKTQSFKDALRTSHARQNWAEKTRIALEKSSESDIIIKIASRLVLNSFEECLTA
jgi:hypothetical protein